jgi:hypothetical protein
LPIQSLVRGCPEDPDATSYTPVGRVISVLRRGTPPSVVPRA